MMAELEVLNCTYCEEPQQGAQRVILPIIMVLIAAVGITGNSLVLFIILGHRDMRTVTNSFVASLALTDIAILVICVIPTAVVYVTNTWKLGEFLCRAASYTQAVTVQATCFTLTAMTVDRYYLIVHAVRSRNTRTVTKAVIINVFIWIVSSLIHLASFIYVHLTEDGTCKSDFPNAQVSDKVYGLFSFLGMYIVPLICIMFCYTQILIQIWRKTSGGTESAQAHTRALRRKRKITRMVFIVVVLFAFCWAPIQIFTVWSRFSLSDSDESKDLTVVQNLKVSFVCIAYANSCVNPFVYAFTTTSFRKYFRKMFATCCRSPYKERTSISISMTTKTERLPPGEEDSSI
ncbi:G-protein coupled receptor 54-like [Acanthaster planci]|uniref:G-protein coupled receptor 54-like n=1 Tax=Acanthaster planci TaxID=133434 RepID=A0A8B7YVU0_ACAPL|nr:G-protein coupled receptor 54-like [Acanthaster planci]